MTENLPTRYQQESATIDVIIIISLGHSDLKPIEDVASDSSYILFVEFY